jgi:Glycosyl hydrolases family 43
MASRWGRFAAIGALIGLFTLPRLTPPEAQAGAAPPPSTAPTELIDPSRVCAEVEQSAMVHVFDTTSLGGRTYYVNDHTLIQGPGGEWHLFGIFHQEPMRAEIEIDFVHAVAAERDPARWGDGSFEVAAEPYRIALHADPSIGETHVWAPHVVRSDGRYVMVYQSGGPDDDHAAIRLAESDDLYHWTRIGRLPLFEDICVARDPMLVRREGAWALYYTRCDSITGRHSGVAYRLSHDLVHWSEARMALSLERGPASTNSGYTESPFVFERGGSYWLSVSAYPLAWDATLVYRSSVPSSFADVPYTRLRARAAEWVFGARGELWLTHAGPGQGGVWMSAIDGIGR